MGSAEGATYEILGGHVAVIRMRNPPLNPLSIMVRTELLSALRRAEADQSVAHIIIRGAGNAFSAGADIREMKEQDAILRSPGLPTVVDAIESLSKPVTALVDGVALGGGCEVALGCHYRVATKRARLGLPEVNIGLIPGAGGTQRLPRLVDTSTALRMITTGEMVPASRALSMGLVDLVVEGGDPLAEAVVFADRRIREDALDARRCGNMPLKDTPEAALAAVEQAMAKVGAPVKGQEAAWAGVQAVRAAVEERSYGRGKEVEAQLFASLIQSQQSRARRYLFLAERAAGRVPPPAKGGAAGAPPAIKRVGIVGAGTMGSGIAIAHLLAGLEVVLVENKEAALKRGVGMITKSVESAVKRGKLSAEKAKGLAKNLKPTTDMTVLRDCDLAIEAVFEDMSLKQEIFRKLDGILRADAILCTNTSTLDVDAVAGVTGRPDRVMGMHFFSPAHIMPLVECIRGSETSQPTIAAIMGLTKRLGKIGVLVGNCDGFVGNRMLKSYTDETMYLLEEGASPRQIDSAVRAFGFPIGPLEMADLAGNDISWYIRKARGLTDPSKRKPGVRYCTLGDKLCEMGRFGQKTGKGWYRYEAPSRQALDDPEVLSLLEKHRKEVGKPRRDISDDEIIARCFYPLINEGFKILEEGIAERPSDIDVVWAHGYSWPRWRGGPMFWADEIGLPTLQSKLEQYQAKLPDVPHWAPASLLQRLVTEGRSAASLGDQSGQRSRL